MSPECETLMSNATPSAPYDESVWRRIIDELLSDFAAFVGQDFDIDDIWIDADEPSIGGWLASRPREAIRPGGSHHLAVGWIGVFGGNITDTSGCDAFGVGLSVFLLHGAGRKRLFSHDGMHFVEFAFEKWPDDPWKWRSLGWYEDEWREWEGIICDD